mgnify:CR=1 FL=1
MNPAGGYMDMQWMSWTQLYPFIRSANIAIQKLTANEGGLEAGLTKRLLGEDHFMRGYLFSQLMRQYGGVVLLTEPLTLESEAENPRSSFEATVNQIISGGTLSYRVSICGKTYIAIEDVFKYVTLGGSLPKQDIEYLRDDVNNYIYGNDYVFSDQEKIKIVSNFGNFMRDQNPDIIEVVRYQMKDYRLIAKVCLDYAYRYNKYIAY